MSASKTSFVEILRAIDDADLDVYEFRMWVHIWRVGTSWESLRTVARKCGMSLGRASKARQSLFDRNMLVYQQRNGKLGLAAVLRSSGEQCSPDEQPQHSNRSPGEQNVHLMNTDVHQVNDSVHQVNAILSMPLEEDLMKGEKNARETTPQSPPVVPSPPLIKTEPRDRTPGGNGYHPPKEPTVPKREPSPEVAAIGAIANALTAVTGVSARLNWDRISALAADLHEAGYTASQITTAYSRQPSAGWHWYTNDWRGRKGDRPTPENVRETIAGATIADVKITKPNAIQRALAAFGTAPHGDNPI